MIDLYEYENSLVATGYRNIVGVDEAGRGPMAGPLVVAACLLPLDDKIIGLNDSKKLTPKKREELYNIIKEKAIEYHIEVIDVGEVDKLNVYKASKWGMEQCIKQFKTPIDYVLSDAMPLDIDLEYLAIVKGDAKSASIAAASILAKVTRDHIMIDFDEVYPQYGFKKHKGYITKEHKSALEKYGVCPLHRRSFAPVIEAIRRK
ncbi:MAG TPA: ribonuclease HII [Bacilli bacterium]|jgi:ribonuclease HII|nr:ribonuclease HII [Bacilli bacterium]HOD60562.1 ribonuclease HII [Bacilli bacterium]HOH61872.1 ribonuclease HII [Bacilli bacterium]HPB49151.1 ribonuclease HII [Bacilli bacterium]HPM14536.1 ribonuclease HII [Bacilli bacterium]